MEREIVGLIIDNAKNLRLTLSIGFLENKIKQIEQINFNESSFYDIWLDNDDYLHFYDNSNKHRNINH